MRYGVRVVGYELRGTSCALWFFHFDFHLCEVRVTSHKFRDAGCPPLSHLLQTLRRVLFREQGLALPAEAMARLG